MRSIGLHVGANRLEHMLPGRSKNGRRTSDTDSKFDFSKFKIEISKFEFQNPYIKNFYIYLRILKECDTMRKMKHEATIESAQLVTDAQETANLLLSAFEERVSARVQKLSEKCKCPNCHSLDTKQSKVAGVFNCRECNAYFGNGYNRIFPAWARDRKVGRRTQRRHFRRALCLIMGLTKEFAV